MKQEWMGGILILFCLMATGCPSEFERLADFAERSSHEQAKQNLEMVKLNEELARNNQQIQAERMELNDRFSELELERRRLHHERRSELAWAESLRFLATLIAASLPLFLCAFLIWAATKNKSDQQLLNELLVAELTSNKPRLITDPTRVPADSSNRSTQKFIANQGEQDVTHRKNRNGSS